MYCLEDAAGGDLGAVSAFSVVNNSEYTPPVVLSALSWPCHDRAENYLVACTESSSYDGRIQGTTSSHWTLYKQLYPDYGGLKGFIAASESNLGVFYADAVTESGNTINSFSMSAWFFNEAAVSNAYLNMFSIMGAGGNGYVDLRYQKYTAKFELFVNGASMGTPVFDSAYRLPSGGLYESSIRYYHLRVTATKAYLRYSETPFTSGVTSHGSPVCEWDINLVSGITDPLICVGGSRLYSMGAYYWIDYGDIKFWNNDVVPDDFSDIILWCGFEGTLGDGSYTFTSDEYPSPSAGQVEVYYPGAVTAGLSTSDKIVGAKSFQIASNEGDAAYRLDLFPGVGEAVVSSGRVGFWYKNDGAAVGSHMLQIGGYGSDWPYSKILITIANSAGSLDVKCGTFGYDDPYTYVFPSGLATCNTTGGLPWDKNWHFYEFAWDASDFGLKVLRNGTLLGTYTGWGTPLTETMFSFTIGQLWIETATPLPLANFHMDNLIVSTDPDRNLYALANLSTCPRTV